MKEKLLVGLLAALSVSVLVGAIWWLHSNLSSGPELSTVGVITGKTYVPRHERVWTSSNGHGGVHVHRSSSPPRHRVSIRWTPIGRFDAEVAQVDSRDLYDRALEGSAVTVYYRESFWRGEHLGWNLLRAEP